jgi:hypothetical protein
MLDSRQSSKSGSVAVDERVTYRPAECRPQYRARLRDNHRCLSAPLQPISSPVS